MKPDEPPPTEPAPPADPPPAPPGGAPAPGDEPPARVGACPTLDHIRWAAENPRRPRARQITTHVRGCPLCTGVRERDAWPTADGRTPSPVVIPGYLRPYRDRMVGKGGMGEVYRRYDRYLWRPVAVKVIAWKEWTKADWYESHQLFLNEFRLTAWLQHPGIPPVHVVGVLPDGRPYLVMRLLRGRTLRQALDRATARSTRRPGRTRRAALVDLVERVCEAVEFAHRHGVAHLDLKPRNVFVRRSGQVLVLDWGLARVVGEPERGATGPPGRAGAPPGGPKSPRGSLGYAPPEQWRGEGDVRSDVFSLAAILCEVVTGKRPYSSVPGLKDELAATRARLLAEADDTGLCALVARCLAADPADRLPDAGALRAALRHVREAPARRAQAAEDKAARLKRWLVVMGILVVVTAAGVVVGLQAVIHRYETILQALRSVDKTLKEVQEKHPAELVKEFEHPDVRDAMHPAHLTPSDDDLAKWSPPDPPPMLVSGVARFVFRETYDKELAGRRDREQLLRKVRALGAAAERYRRFHDAADRAGVTVLFDPNTDAAARLDRLTDDQRKAALDTLLGCFRAVAPDLRPDDPADLKRVVKVVAEDPLNAACRGPAAGVLELAALAGPPARRAELLGLAGSLDTKITKRAEARGWLLSGQGAAASWAAVGKDREQEKWLLDAPVEAVLLLAHALTREGHRAEAVGILQKYLSLETPSADPGGKPKPTAVMELYWVQMTLAVHLAQDTDGLDTKPIDLLLMPARQIVLPPRDHAAARHACGDHFRRATESRLLYTRLLRDFILDPSRSSVSEQALRDAVRQYPDHGGLHELLRLRLVAG